MKVGSGFVVKRIHGRDYLYVWTFEVRGAGMRRVERYIGRADRPESKHKALRTLEGHAARASAALERRRAQWRRQLAAP